MSRSAWVPVASACRLDGGRGEAFGGVAGDLGALGGVLGQVAGDHEVGDGAGAAHGDDPHVQLGPQPMGHPAGLTGCGGVR